MWFEFKEMERDNLSKPDGPQDDHFSTSSMASAIKAPLSTHNAPSDTLTQDTGTFSPSMHACLTPRVRVTNTNTSHSFTDTRLQ